MEGFQRAEVHIESSLGESGHIYRNSSAHDNNDLIFRSYLQNLDAGEDMYYHADSRLYSSQGFQTAWTVINLDHVLDDIIAFYVTRNSSFYINDAIAFDNEVINIGNGFNMDFSYFTAPKEGFYYLSYSIGQESGTSSRVDLRTWDMDSSDYPQTEVSLTKNASVHNGCDMHSRSTIKHLQQNEDVWVTLIDGSIYSDPERTQISFTGFRYNPVNASQTAWAVHRNVSWYGTSPYDPVEFQIVDANAGDAFNTENNSVIITTSGIYYMEVNVGSLPDQPVGVDIMLSRLGQPDNVNTSVMAEVTRAFHSGQGVDNVGRSLLVHLQAGDSVWLRAWAYTGIFSDEDKSTTFLGFLVLEDV